MDIAQLMRNLIRHAPADSSKSLELRSGQVVRGVIMQVLPNQEAIVQIEGVQVRAKLEAPLLQGQATFLQVQPESASGQLVLKPFDMNQQPLSAASLAQLLKELNIKDDELNRMIVQLLRREGLQVSANQIRLFRSVIDFKPQQTEARHWLQAAVIAHHKGLPLSKGIVGALHQVMHGPSFQSLSDKLTQHLTFFSQSDHLGNSAEARSIANRLAQAFAVLRTMWQAPMQSAGMSGQDRQAQAPLAQTTSTLLAAQDNRGTVTQSNPTGSGQPVSTQGMTGQAASDPVLYTAGSNQTSLSAQNESNPIRATQGQILASPTQHSSLTDGSPMMARSDSPISAATPNPLGERPVQGFMGSPAPQIAGAELSRQAAHEAALTHSGGQGRPGIAETESLNPNSLPNNKGQTETTWISRIMKLLGVESERNWMQLASTMSARGTSASAIPFHHANANFPLEQGQLVHPAETVKSSLQQLLNLEELPQMLRETAQQALQHITGQQLLLTSDRQSVFTQFTLMIPILTEQGESQAAIHIQSRRTGKDEIDADHCRLVFDLEMSHLGEMLIDVQVVDRTVSIHVYNNHPKMSDWMGDAKPAISDALEQLGYRCAIWKCEPLLEKNELSSAMNKTEEAASLNWSHAFQPYKGVDLRI